MKKSLAALTLMFVSAAAFIAPCARAVVYSNLTDYTVTADATTQYIYISPGSSGISADISTATRMGFSIRLNVSLVSGVFNVSASGATISLESIWYVCGASDLAAIYSYGDTIDTASLLSEAGMIDTDSSTGNWYDAGSDTVTGYLAFYNSKTNYLVWLEVEVNKNTDTVTILSCAVSTDSGDTFLVGTVPEPAQTAAALGVVSCLGILFMRRRSR